MESTNILTYKDIATKKGGHNCFNKDFVFVWTTWITQLARQLVVWAIGEAIGGLYGQLAICHVNRTRYLSERTHTISTAFVGIPLDRTIKNQQLQVHACVIVAPKCYQQSLIVERSSQSLSSAREIKAPIF